MPESWWLATPDGRLSQGDVIDPAAWGTLVSPRSALKKKTFSGGALAWGEVTDKDATDANGQMHMLARGRVSAVIVASHSCELDKKERKGRILVAPILAASGLGESNRIIVFEQRRLSLFGLPDVPGLGDMYADLRYLQPLDRDALEKASKFASMTPDATVRFQQQLAGFFARPPHIGEGVGTAKDTPPAETS